MSFFFFSFLSQKYRKMIKYLYFISGFYRHIWLNIFKEEQSSHHFDYKQKFVKRTPFRVPVIFLGQIFATWRQKELNFFFKMRFLKEKFDPNFKKKLNILKKITKLLKPQNWIKLLKLFYFKKLM